MRSFFSALLLLLLSVSFSFSQSTAKLYINASDPRVTISRISTAISPNTWVVVFTTDSG